MVQRKLLNKKLGIQDYDDNRILRKPSHHLDGKTRGPELKKKMKKSRSTKVSDMEAGLRAVSPLKKTMAQPEKPPPFNVSSPKKQPLIKTGDGAAPNYMKSTTCSEARKESSPVSTRVSQNQNSDSKRYSSSSNSSSGSGKASSLKLVMKTPSFKPVRSSAKKHYSRVVLCSDINAQRATCSSTLKDSKIPPYLMLNHGGTSVMKVCPYSYCSLNGHHHTPVPPLKSFLSARRRSLKNQRSMKIEAVDLRKGKPFADGALSPLGRGNDFFIEIYAEKNRDDVEAIGGSTEKNLEETKCVTADFVENGEAEGENDDKQVSESLSEGSPHSEIDLDENHYTISVGMEWEEEEFSVLESENEAYSSMETDDEFHVYISSEKILIDGEKQEAFEDDSADDDKLSQVSCSLDYDQGSFIEDVSAEMEEEEAEADFIGSSTIPVSKQENSEADQIETMIYNRGPEQEFPSAQDGARMEDEVTEAELLAGEQIADSSQIHSGADEVDNVGGKQSNQSTEACQDDINFEEGDSNQDVSDESLSFESQDHLLGDCDPDSRNNVLERKIPSSIDSEEHKDPMMLRSHLAEAFTEAERMEDEGNDGSDAAKLLTTATDTSNQESESKISLKGSETNQELRKNIKWTIKSKKQHEDSEYEREFNPREPNYLPLVPEPDAEKLDLKHQEMDERKNSEEWMLDYALRQAVDKLAPARKRKVALLVEAFETVLPTPFAHGRPIQACS